MTEKKKAVGFAVLTENPEGQRAVLLQGRGELNPEKRGPESFKDAFQLTVHGDLKPAEHPIFGLLREMKEELGPEAAKWIANEYSGKKPFLQKVDEAEGEKRVVLTFGVYLAPDKFWEFFSKIRLHAGSGGLILATKTEIEHAQKLHERHKEIGVPNRVTFGIYMFRDERDAALKVFEVLSK